MAEAFETITQSTEIEDIMSNPEKFGMPTFEQFKKNPDKYRLNKNHLVEAVDRGTSLFGNVSHHVYKFKTKSGMIYDCGESLEKVEYIAKQEGCELRDCKCSPELREGYSTRIWVEVTFEAP